MPVQSQHRFSVGEFYRMAETGILRPDARVELLDGRIIDMSPIGSFHSGVVTYLIQVFTAVARGRWIVSAQNPVRLDDQNEPEPDFMLLKPTNDFYRSRHPGAEDVLLLVEVADSSLEFDRTEKLPIYGRMGVSEVWIVNLLERTIEVYREPHFTGYGFKKVASNADSVSPLLFPDAAIRVSDVLRL